MGINKLFERALPKEKRRKENVLRKEFVPYYDQHNADKSRPYPGITELLTELQTKGVQLQSLPTNIKSSYRETNCPLLSLQFVFIAVFGNVKG